MHRAFSIRSFDPKLTFLVLIRQPRATKSSVQTHRYCYTLSGKYLLVGMFAQIPYLRIFVAPLRRPRALLHFGVGSSRLTGAVLYSRALFKGAADMQQQLTGSDKTLDSSLELAPV